MCEIGAQNGPTPNKRIGTPPIKPQIEVTFGTSLNLIRLAFRITAASPKTICAPIPIKITDRDRDRDRDKVVAVSAVPPAVISRTNQSAPATVKTRVSARHATRNPKVTACDAFVLGERPPSPDSSSDVG